MAINLKQVREKLNQKLPAHPEWLQELHIKDASELSSLSDSQLEQRLSPKILGFLSGQNQDSSWSGKEGDDGRQDAAQSPKREDWKAGKKDDGHSGK